MNKPFRVLASLALTPTAALAAAQARLVDAQDSAGLQVVRSMTIAEWVMVVAVALVIGLATGWLVFRRKVQGTSASHAQRMGLLTFGLVFLLVNVVAPPLIHWNVMVQPKAAANDPDAADGTSAPTAKPATPPAGGAEF